jgi:multidrug efflux system outer membrane protein
MASSSGAPSAKARKCTRATQVQALGSAYVMAEQRYRSGVASYLEVLDAERQLFSAQLALVQAQRQYLVAGVDLYRALGGGWNVALH